MVACRSRNQLRGLQPDVVAEYLRKFAESFESCACAAVLTEYLKVSPLIEAHRATKSRDRSSPIFIEKNVDDPYVRHDQAARMSMISREKMLTPLSARCLAAVSSIVVTYVFAGRDNLRGKQRRMRRGVIWRSR